MTTNTKRARLPAAMVPMAVLASLAAGCGETRDIGSSASAYAADAESLRPLHEGDASVAPAAACGNGIVDPAEECDDADANDANGCRSDCTYTCVSNADCDDHNVCSGVEQCDPSSHRCVAGTPDDCDDGNPCTDDFCHPVRGCFSLLHDEDGDGLAPASLGACGLDCDDTGSALGLEGIGDGIDSDCDGREICFLDADDDGYLDGSWDTVRSDDADCDDPFEAYGSDPVGDCASDDATIHPGATDPPSDGADRDCDGED